MDWERLYRKLSESDAADFDTIEAEFCSALHLSTAPDKRPACVTAFLTIANWAATSMRSGVWTFYEATPSTEIQATLDYLVDGKHTELADIFASGIHEYQDPKYAENFQYPDEWITESDVIDQWISRHEAQIFSWEMNLLLTHKDLICSL